MEDRRASRFDVDEDRWMGGEIPGEGAGRVLLDLSACRVTGLWEVYAGSSVYRLALRSGVPIHAFPGRVPWLLGEVLAYLGAPLGAGTDEIRRLIALNPGRSGEVLASLGVVRPKHVEWALKEQICLRASEFLDLRHGRYRVWAGSRFLKGAPRQPDRWRPEELLTAIRRPHPANDDLRLLLGRLSAMDPFGALGLPPTSSRDEIRSAFLALAKKHHPDRIPRSASPERRALHRLVFEASVRAYETARAA